MFVPPVDIDRGPFRHRRQSEGQRLDDGSTMANHRSRQGIAQAFQTSGGLKQSVPIHQIS
ncbi:MAG TPA: hypothetical protein PLB97_04520 [Accumulibacter sp.]|jgi:hypothetical protein|nr:hypothetical protein [Accumulibacter sp.]